MMQEKLWNHSPVACTVSNFRRKKSPKQMDQNKPHISEGKIKNSQGGTKITKFEIKYV